MSILLNKGDRVLVQGITGREGSKAAFDMIAYGTHVVAGVTPGKGGMHVGDVPVYNTVVEAQQDFPGICASLVTVPGAFARAAILEAIDARIPLIVVLAESLLIYDVAYLLARAKENDVRILGPSSIGLISPGRVKIGSIGSGGIDRKVFSSGKIGVVSKSGGMTSEIAWALTSAGFGQSSVLGIGGEVIAGSTFADIAKLFDVDNDTEAIVVFGEVGGGYEEQLAEKIVSGKIRKPVVALIAGVFAESLGLSRGTVLGHAGAIVGEGDGSASSKITKLQNAGVHIAYTPEDIPKILRACSKSNV